jgi:hypothetical protein
MRDLLSILALKSSWFYYVPTILQIALIIHVVRTGRPFYWIWILLFFPGIGGIAYLVLEFMPDYRRGGGSFWTRFQTRGMRIKKLRERLEETDSVRNRIALAEELRLDGQLDQAAEIMRECIRGVFKDDAYVLCEMARIDVEQRKWPEALNLITAASKEGDRILRMQLELLKARSLAGSNLTAEAEAILRTISQTYLGDEARFRLAELLESSNRKKEAAQLYEEIIKKFRKSNASWRRTEREWFKSSKNRLKSLKSEK